MSELHGEACTSVAPGSAELLEVAAGVFAWIQPDGSWWINNAGAVTGNGEAFVVDTCATAERTRRFLGALDDASGGAKVTRAANTHEHGDHTYGNVLLPEDAELIGHPTMADHLAADLLIDGCPPIWEPVPDWGVAGRRVPTTLVADRASYELGGHQVELMHPGYAAHTEGDLVAFVRDVGVLFTGDLIFHGLTPLVFAGSVSGARAALRWIAELAPAVLVPGHGPLVTRSELDGVLAEHEAYLGLVQELADAGLAAGKAPLEVAESADLGRFASWADAERLVLNLHRAFADASGGALDVLAAFADAMAFNGGPLTTHVCCT